MFLPNLTYFPFTITGVTSSNQASSTAGFARDPEESFVAVVRTGYVSSLDCVSRAVPPAFDKFNRERAVFFAVFFPHPLCLGRWPKAKRAVASTLCTLITVSCGINLVIDHDTSATYSSHTHRCAASLQARHRWKEARAALRFRTGANKRPRSNASHGMALGRSLAVCLRL